MDYFASVRNKPSPAPTDTTNVTPIRRSTAEGLHPYARRVIDDELARLDTLHHVPAGHPPHWDETTYEVACNLLEIANSPWSGYTVSDAHTDLHARAPRDGGFDDRRIDQKWASAEKKVGNTGRPEPTPRDDTALTALPTIEADDSVSEDVGPPLNPVIDWHDLFASEDDGEEWIVEPLLPARRMIALYSAPKAGKSLLMLEIAVAIAAGTQVLGTAVDQARRVLYVDFENDPRGDIRSRLEAMDIGPDDLDGLCYLSYPSLAKLDTPTGAIDLIRHVKHYDCEVVVIDTLSRSVAGDENENDTWLAFYRNTGLALKQHGIACIRLDHSGKDAERGMRGGSAKYGDVDAVWRLRAVGEDTVHLECTDNRMLVPTKALTLVREEYPLRHRLASDAWQGVADAKTREADEFLDRLGVPNTASSRDAKKALREAGHRLENKAIENAVRARKLRLDVPSTSVPGTPPGHPGTPEGSVPGPPPPKGAAGTPSAASPGRPQDDPDELVSCRACFKPTTAAVATRNDGLCATCHRHTGQTKETL